MSKRTPWIALFLSCISVPFLEAHFLWKVDTEEPSYLFGTVHSSDAAVRNLPPEIVEALRRSATFHPELEFSPENIGRLTAAIFAGESGDLEDDLPPALWNRLVENGRQAGFPTFLLRRLPVRLASLVFGTPPGAEYDQIVDIQAYQHARDNELDIHPLETVEEQIGIFKDLTREQAISFLEEALDEFEAGFPTQDKIIRLYADRDIEALSKFVKTELARTDLPDFTHQLLNRRNDRMTDRLLSFIEDGSAFVAVGVAHMPGEQGLIARLEKKGYTISRVPLGGTPDRK